MTAAFVSKTKAPGTYADRDGLRLIITPAGTKKWELLLRVDGRRRKLGLGLFPTVTLERARELTQDHRRAVKNGSPLPSHREKIAAARVAAGASIRPITVEEAFAKFWPVRRARLSNGKHVQQWETTLATYAWPKLGGRPIAEVRAGEIIETLAPIWHEKPETASRVLQRLHAIFENAILKGERELANPCVGVGKELGLGHKGDQDERHHRSLPWREMGSVFKLLHNRTGLPSTRLCFEFLILTAARSGEARHAQWDEIDLDAKLRTIPGERMKTRKRHRVPLCDRAIEILHEARALHPRSQLIFPGAAGTPLSDMTLTKVLRDGGLSDVATVHGFRSSFKEWATHHSFDDMLSELALAHIDKNKVRAAYQRSDQLEKRQPMMESWAEYCGQQRAACIEQG